MAHHPRIEHPSFAQLCTTRTRNSELWFVNNKALHKDILGYFAKNIQVCKAKTYGIAIEGSHIHHLTEFPEMNNSAFHRVFNRCVNLAVKRHTDFTGGSLWGRRFSNEFVPEDADIEERFFYVVLQPVQDGLVTDITHYPGYNCFEDAISGRTKSFELIDWAAYNSALRYNKNVDVKRYIREYELTYARVPGHEHKTQAEYEAYMREQLAQRTAKIVAAKEAQGWKYVDPAALKKVKAGTPAKNPKVSGLDSKRPRILCSNPKVFAEMCEWYFEIYDAYQIKSAEYRAGDRNVVFPPGTYPPPLGVTEQDD